jgi:aspartyl-tRNA(Asn)/glutamyl-tRNA(Gln) amidotransferase subunit C
MSKVDAALISRLEKLARLQLGDAEREKMTADLEQILAMIDQLQQVNTEGVEPLVHLSDRTDALRDDLVQHQLSTEAALSNAPKSDGRYFRVPKVIE